MPHLVAMIIAFPFVLFGGFLATPGLFHSVNLEYLRLQQENLPVRNDLVKQQSEVDSRLHTIERAIREMEAQGAFLSRQRDQLAKTAASTAPGPITQAGRASASLSDLEQQIGQNLSGLESAKSDQVATKAQREDLQTKIDELNKSLERAASESYNVYLVTRAIALGALGALVSILAKFCADTKIRSLSEQMAPAKVWASMLIGAIVAVVGLGMFYTKQITIFSHGDTSTNTPDYWRVAILCLMGGAFADRLFQAAAGRVGQYLGEAQRRGKGDADVPGRLPARKVGQGRRQRPAPPAPAPAPAPAE